MTMKVCTVCGNSYPLTEFHKNCTHRDGLASECKHCKQIRNKQYRDQIKSIDQCGPHVHIGHHHDDSDPGIYRTHRVQRSENNVRCNDVNPCISTPMNILKDVILRDQSISDQISYHEQCISVLRHLSIIITS